MIRTFHGFHHGHNTASPTDTLRASLRASLRFFPRARTEAGEWRRKPHVKVPSPRTAARRMCAADVPTDFLRSAANWRQGVHSERGKESTRSAAFFAQVHLATNCRARFPASGGASRPLPRGLCPCRTNAAVCGIMQQFAAEDGVVLGTIDWATAADSPTWAARRARRAAFPPSCSGTPRLS